MRKYNIGFESKIIKGLIVGLCLTTRIANYKTVSFLVFDLAYAELYRLSATPAAAFL